MYPIIIFGLIAWALQQNKKEQATRQSQPPRTPIYRTWERPGSPESGARPTPARKIGYVDDGVLSQEETVALILMLKRYKELDSAAQQEMLALMDGRILAQFNHLLNSSWNMDDVVMFEYLAEQGRQGRYTEIGAFALNVRRGM